jgi:hypothetical protein
MKYFKNVELARMYKVSERTIGNWIESAKENKIDLNLIEENNREYIVNTTHNHTILKSLSEKGKKYKNKNAYKIISPKKEFYDLFSEKQIIDIISNLESYNEIPQQYAYFDDAAEYWDQYCNKLSQEKDLNILTGTIELINLNLDYIDSLTKNYDFVNIVDLALGNALPAKGLTEYFYKNNKLKKYIGIDYSADMLKIAERNLKTWFGKDFPFEGHVKDMNFDKYQDLLFENTNNIGGKRGINLVSFLGGAYGNQRLIDQPFYILNSSMGVKDILIFTDKLDTVNSRMYFDFNSSDKNSGLDERNKFVLDLLNITEDDYEIEQYYSAELKSRIISICLKIDLQLNFQTKNFIKDVKIAHNDRIILLRINHQDFPETIDQFYRTNFEVLHTSRTNNNEEVLMVGKIKTANNM